MASRLVLSTVGIKSPLDVGDVEEAPRAAKRRGGDPTTPPRRPATSRRRRPAPAKPPRPSEGARSGELPFHGSGRPLQTSIALDGDCAALLDELARAASVSANALAVAALHAGLPGTAEDARAAIVDERVSRAGGASPGSSATFAFPSSCVRASTSSHPRRAGACRAPRARTSSTRRFAGAFRSMPSSPRSLSPITPDALSARRRRRRLIPRSGSP